MSSDIALGSLWCFQPQGHQTSSGSTNSFKRMGLPDTARDFVMFASQSYNNLHETITIYSITCQTSLERNQLQTSFLGTNPWKIANQSVTTTVCFCRFWGHWAAIEPQNKCIHVGDAIGVGVVCSQRIRHPKESFCFGISGGWTSILPSTSIFIYPPWN